jgi:hypothetical protein
MASAAGRWRAPSSFQSSCQIGAAINSAAIFLVQNPCSSTTGCCDGNPGLHGMQRMSKARALLPHHHRMMAAGTFLCLAGLAAWSTATAFGQSASPPTPPQPTSVLISVSTLDMSRLAPAQFGDWDAAANPTR